VHRPEHFEMLTGLRQGQTIRIEDIANLLIHPQGGLKNIPPGATRIALLNQADTADLRETARKVAGKLLAGGFDRVVIGALRDAPGGMEAFS
jgi:probable selenium-dependent hydroxylase accessory protein YqeC